MTWRGFWSIYVGVLLLLVGAWFMSSPADAATVCGRAVAPNVEWGEAGVSLLPPGYRCLTTSDGSFVTPLDSSGWIEWGMSLAIPLTLLLGCVCLVVQLGSRRRSAAGS